MIKRKIKNIISNKVHHAILKYLETKTSIIYVKSDEEKQDYYYRLGFDNGRLDAFNEIDDLINGVHNE